MTSATSVAVARARGALLAAAPAVPLVEPMAATLLRAQRDFGLPIAAGPLIQHWCSRALGNAASRDRYPWELVHAKGTGVPDYAGPAHSWRAWRASEQPLVERDVFGFEERLMMPIVISECAELLAEAAREEASAGQLLDEVEPVLRRDFSSVALEQHAWADTFALCCAVRYPLLLERLRPVIVAASESYAARAHKSGGVVMGTRYPLHQRPLVSATAQLGGALLALGSHVELVAGAASFVASHARAAGAWADADDPADVLTTFVAADFLASVDPAYDPRPTLAFVCRAQETSGFFRAFGPEMPWLTRELGSWLERAVLPFARRFRFPSTPTANLDRKTALPFYAYFGELARLFASVTGLGAAKVEVAFIDLIGFREFNNRSGQALGDDVLAEFAAALRELGAARVVRDGGDEFLIVGAPTRSDLAADVLEVQRRWPARFRARFGDGAPPVLARALVGTTRASKLIEAREHLGRAIGQLKTAPVDAELGILQSVALS